MKGKKNSFKEIFMKNRKAYLSVLVCLFVVYALLIAGMGSFGGKSEKTPGADSGDGASAGATPTPVVTSAPDKEQNIASVVTPEPTPAVTPESESAGSNQVSVKDDKPQETVKSVAFSPEDGISWPVEGEIIMKYSMDHGVYHETLSQFMTNDGLLIDSSKGEMVKSCCEALVTDIYTDTRRGKCVELTAGDYTFVYGQLSSVSVSVGDVVKEGSAVGMVGDPTKYYTEEGAHLYFKVECGEETIDPATLFRSETGES